MKDFFDLMVVIIFLTGCLCAVVITFMMIWNPTELLVKIGITNLVTIFLAVMYINIDCA